MVKVREIMTTPVHTVDPEMSFSDLERFFSEKNVSGAPVVEDGAIAGVISRADVVRRLGEEQAQADLTLSFYQSPWDEPVSAVELLAKRSGSVAERMVQLRVKDAMTKRVLAVWPDDPVDVVAKAMVQHGVHRILVRDGEAIAGVVSSLDLVRLLAERGLGS